MLLSLSYVQLNFLMLWYINKSLIQSWEIFLSTSHLSWICTLFLWFSNDTDHKQCNVCSWADQQLLFCYLYMLIYKTLGFFRAHVTRENVYTSMHMECLLFLLSIYFIVQNSGTKYSKHLIDWIPRSLVFSHLTFMTTTL